tara:strand:+ start:653 stop:1891 length:1239 start_codon:yes stop_codon:yes gene_type:complete
VCRQWDSDTTTTKMANLLKHCIAYQPTGKEFLLTETLNRHNTEHLRRVKDVASYFRFDRRDTHQFSDDGWREHRIDDQHYVGYGEFLALMWQILVQRTNLPPVDCAVFAQSVADSFFVDQFKCPKSKMCGSYPNHPGCCNFAIGIATWSFAREVISNKINRELVEEMIDGPVDRRRLTPPWDIFGVDRMINNCEVDNKTNYWFETKVDMQQWHRAISAMPVGGLAYCNFHEMSQDEMDKKRDLYVRIRSAMRSRERHLYGQALRRFDSVTRVLCRDLHLRHWPYFDFCARARVLVPKLVKEHGLGGMGSLSLWTAFCPHCHCWMFFTRPTGFKLRCRTCRKVNELMFHFDCSKGELALSTQVLTTRPGHCKHWMDRHAACVARLASQMHAAAEYRIVHSHPTSRPDVELCLI